METAYQPMHKVSEEVKAYLDRVNNLLLKGIIFGPEKLERVARAERERVEVELGCYRINE